MSTDPIPTPRCDAQSYHDGNADQMVVPTVLGEQLETENMRLTRSLTALVHDTDCFVLPAGQRCTRLRKNCPACDARLLLEELGVEKTI